jgi:pyruvate dehydrogenase phosphatase regulatory subunit
MSLSNSILPPSCRLAAGSSRFCAGIVSTARHLTIEQKMADYSNKLYYQLEQETGIQTGKQVSSSLPDSYLILNISGPITRFAWSSGN